MNGIQEVVGSIPISSTNLPLTSRPFLLLTLASAAAVRLFALGREPLWADETFTVRAARSGVVEILTSNYAWELNPPLYSLLMRAWIAVAGDGAIAVRLPSVLFGVLTVWVGYAIAREIGSERFARIAAVLLAVWPILVRYSQEARGYGLFALTAALSHLAFLRIARGRAGRRDVAGYAVATALCLYRHNQAWFVLAAQWLAAAALAVRRRAWPAR